MAEGGEYRLSRDIAGVQELVAQNSRRYAKRQVTFFSGMPEVKWIEAANTSEAVLQIRREIELFLGG
jgi:tRNA dimethylallyltransferase